METLSVLFYTFIFTYISLPHVICTQKPPNIAIIGGGIGGTSCAYFLKNLFEGNISMTVFEKDEVGGRLKLLDIEGQKYEAGGAIIHSRNQYMVQFSKILGLSVRKPDLGKLGVYDGHQFVFEESDWILLSMFRMIWRYGLSVFHLYKDVQAIIEDFSRIYSLQKKGYAYTSVDRLLDSMNPSFNNMTQASLSDILLKKGYPERFLNELVQSVMMVNYGQTNSISGFAGYVSLTGADTKLWSVEGGNYLVPEGLLEESGADLLKANVLEVVLLPNQSFSIKYSSDNEIQSKNFDIIVLAAPLIKGNDNIKFVNFQQNFQQFERPYHQTVATFVKGTLNPLSFRRNSVPDDILASNPNLLFNSISEVLPVGSSKRVDVKGVYKVFSQKPLQEKEIVSLFQDVEMVKQKVWLAYPHYNPPEKFTPFILHPRLYYTNAIELSASAMEMSSISAKNIALLIYNSWKNSVDKIDVRNYISKDEL